MARGEREGGRGGERSRDVRNRFFNFGSVSVRFLKKNSDSVRNEFGAVPFAKTRFGSDSYLLLT